MEFVRKRLRRLVNWARTQEAERDVRQAAGSGVRGIFTYTSRAELASLYRVAGISPAGTNGLEIGSHLGASACYIGTALSRRGGLLFCVDTWNNETMPEGEQDTLAAFTANTHRLSGTVVAVRKRSEDLRTSDLKLPLGLVFIDGDHSYEACLRDFETVRDWVSPGGIVAFHDAISTYASPRFPGVQRVVGAALASGDWQFAGHTESLCWIKRAYSGDDGEVVASTPGQCAAGDALGADAIPRR
jgi:predicted O-methyltransferase YrrM